MTKAGVWRHWKGALYRVLFNARNSTNGESGTEMIVYISLTTGRYHVREEEEFHAFVYRSDGRTCKNPLGTADAIGDAEFCKQVAQRFEYVGDDVPVSQ